MTWSYLFFDSDSLQRTDIEQLKDSARIASDSVDMTIDQLQDAKKRIAQLELTVEALLRVLETKNALAREEVALMVQRVDLSDGVEDRRMGPDRTRAAPKCTQCARPLNPRREACLYCGTEITNAVPQPPPPRMTECRGCSKKLPEADAFITIRGLLCSGCYAEL